MFILYMVSVNGQYELISCSWQTERQAIRTSLTNPVPPLLTTSEPINFRLSYGWHRAEILAALINGVFLLALCFSISLEAIERFFNPSGEFTSFECLE